MPQPVELTVIALNLVAGAGLLALLGVLTWVSWGVVRSRTTPQHHMMRKVRQRLVPALWAVLCVFVATGTYGEVSSTSLGLPNAWEVTTADKNRAYALLALGAYLFIIQVFLGLGALTWKGSKGVLAIRARAQQSRENGTDLGTALISTLSLTATLFAVLAMAVVGYLQVLAHTLQ